MALLNLEGSPAGARANPLRVITERQDHPELVFVVDVSGSMARCQAQSEGCLPRLELVKHALRQVVQELGPAASMALVTTGRRNAYRYHRATPGNGTTAALFLTRGEMQGMGAWDARRRRPRASFTWHGTGYLQGHAGSRGAADSLYARQDDAGRLRRLRFSQAGLVHAGPRHVWRYQGSFYSYNRRPLERSYSLLSARYRGPQYRDEQGRSWVLRPSPLTAEATAAELVVVPLSARPTGKARAMALHRLLVRMNRPHSGGLVAGGEASLATAIRSAAGHLAQRATGTGALAARPDPTACGGRTRLVVLLTDGHPARMRAAVEAIVNLRNSRVFRTRPVRTLVVGIPGTEPGAAAALDRAADAGDDGRLNHSAVALTAHDHSTLRRVLRRELFARLRSDYTTSSPGTATAQVSRERLRWNHRPNVTSASPIQRNAAVVASTEYPGWRGHLRVLDLARDPPEEVWDAGEVLKRRSYADRLLLTGMPGTNGGQPVRLMDRDGRVNLDGKCAACGGVGLRQLWRTLGAPPPSREIEAVVHWIAGKGRDWKLGPILRSVPATVGPPARRDLPNYTPFRSSLAKREWLIYVTSNLGLLHAFRIFDGSEAFAFLPPNLLPRLHALWKRGGQSADPRDFAWVLASSPRVGEVPVSCSPCKWRTSLMLAMGPGGRDLMSLDITRPSDCARGTCTLRQPPIRVTAHTRGQAAARMLGETRSTPTLYLSFNGGVPEARVGLGSGYGGQISSYRYNRLSAGLALIRSWRHEPASSLVPFGVIAGAVQATRVGSRPDALATYQADLMGRIVRYAERRPAGRGGRHSIVPRDAANPFFFSPAVSNRGDDSVLLAAVSNSAEEDPPLLSEATLYLRSEADGRVSAREDHMTCRVSDLCSRRPGCPAVVPADCQAPGSRALPVTSPMLLRNRPQKQAMTQMEAFYLLYEPPVGRRRDGMSWIVRVSTWRGEQRLLEVQRLTGVRATGMTLVGGGSDLAINHVGKDGRVASAFLLKGNLRWRLLPRHRASPRLAMR